MTRQGGRTGYVKGSGKLSRQGEGYCRAKVGPMRDREGAREGIAQWLQMRSDRHLG